MLALVSLVSVGVNNVLIGVTRLLVGEIVFTSKLVDEMLLL